MTLKIYLLGHVEISRDDNPLPLKGHKPLALLAYLLLTGKAHTRQHLVDLLYDQADDPKGSLRWTLSQLRQMIGADYLSADRQQISFNFASGYWLDVDTFMNGDTPLYRGDLLEGVSIRDAYRFMDWLSLEREHLREAYQQALVSQLAESEGRGDYQAVLDTAHRLIRLDNFREEWYQSLMRAYALVGHREAAVEQYELCRKVLAAEFGVEPSPEMSTLYEQILAGSVTDPRRLAAMSVQLPAFLQAKQTVADTPPVFVARTRELEQLDDFLSQALAGQTQVAFVGGSPGRGKTALLTEFARRAQEKEPDLLVAIGHCEAQVGIGDPYLPFRDVLGMLTGEVKAPLEAGLITPDHASRLWLNLLPMTQLLLERGQNLIDVLLSGSALLARIKAALPHQAHKLTQLQRLAEAKIIIPGDLTQENIFQQVVNVLEGLAAQKPLLIILDDLQWADATSLSLLFYLGRRLTHHRILLVGAYRLNEVSLGRNGDQHPLDKVLAEFKRTFGDILLDLGQIGQVENQQFIEALLDAEPNHLGPTFRQALSKHTGGHPLFTVELLRAMQERGDLVQDNERGWVEGPSLNWESLPARVEGVIGERIGRLEEELQQLLTVASVEGDVFTAQVIARVEQVNERRLLGQLARTLMKKHRLVHDGGEIQVGKQRLSRYQFNHILFQRYLYHQLDPRECSLLHGEIGEMLEILYGERSPEIAIQLAHHFEKANYFDKARPYLHLAGAAAARRYANDEAVAYFSRVLELTPENNLGERYTLLLAREQVYDLQGKRETQGQDLEVLAELAQDLDNPQKQVEVSLRRANYFENISDYPQALAVAKRAVEQSAQIENPSGEIEGYIVWGKLLWRQGDYEAAREPLERALVLAQINNHQLGQAKSLYYLGQTYLFHNNNYATALIYCQQALEFCQAIGYRQQEGDTLTMLGVIHYELGDLSAARDYYEQVLAIFHTIGDRRGEAILLNNLGNIFCDLGDFTMARDYQERGLNLRITIADRWGQAMSLTNLGLIYHQLGQDETAQKYCEQALVIQREIGDRSTAAYSLTYLGDALAKLGDKEAALTAYTQARQLRQALGQHSQAIDDLAGIAHVLLAQNELEPALEHTEEILAWFSTKGSEGVEHLLEVYLTCYQVLQTKQDPRAADILHTAYKLLQERAAKINDEALRRSFLENVAAHREIVAIFEQML